ncbi:MAG TPA: glycosyltransferase [Usitatibacter sp.]|nr:glycosyltransferase [Usitatibacter sp.]
MLHIVESLDRGAVENWLLRMLRHAVARGQAPDWTFYCALCRPGEKEAEARALGARVVHSPVPLRQKLGFARALRAELARGAHDVLHCHHDLVSALYLVAAARMPLALRIVHAHNADQVVPSGSAARRALLREPMRHTCLRLADRVVGISHHTLDTLLGGRARRPGRDQVHYYGVDPTRIARARGDRAGLRAEFGFPPDARVLLFLARMVPEKNPMFALEVFARLAALEPRAVVLFVGAGSESGAVADRARDMGLDSRVRLAGWRDDGGEIMAASDWFILARPEAPMEGFGVAVVEAQLAGLHLLLSRGIPDDPLLPGASFRRLALAAGPEAWAQAALELARSGAPSRDAAIAALAASPMDMDFALQDLWRLHEARA